MAEQAEYFTIRTLSADAVRGLEHIADAHEWKYIRRMCRDERQRRVE